VTYSPEIVRTASRSQSFIAHLHTKF